MCYHNFMEKEIASITITQEKAQEIMAFYRDYQRPNDGEYIIFHAIYSGIAITIYQNKKGKNKVVFSGPNASQEAMNWGEAKIVEKAEEPKGWLCLENQIGSDEVGVGDFLLPIVVVAAFVRGKDIKTLAEFGVKDSKKVSDDKIREIAPLLLKKFFVSKLVLNNDYYNEVIQKGENLNSIKAKMHNRVLLNMFKKFPDTRNIFIDQFVAEDKYFSYLNDPKEPKVLNVVFKTKGESYYPCVALASIIARYTFLMEKDALEKKYNVSFPCGASAKVNQFALSFIKKHGLEEFKKIAKLNFANYQEILEQLS